jgi:F-type H+-transporting ATPase subunit b
MPLMIEKKELKNALLSAENARNEMQNLQADNQRILQEARERDNMLKEAREMKEKWLLMLK